MLFTCHKKLNMFIYITKLTFTNTSADHTETVKLIYLRELHLPVKSITY